MMTKDQGNTRGNPKNTPAPGDQKVDGFDQVYQMLKIADPAFRESLLQRLSARDVELGRMLREKLARAGV
jgi:hypothetical protein